MSEENYDMAAITALIISGLTADQDDDTIRLEMFKQRVPFNKINSIFRDVAIAEGFKADPKVVKQGVAIELEDVDVEDLIEWQDLQDTVDAIVTKVRHATPALVFRALRAKADEAEVELPSKPKKTGTRRRGVSKVKAAIVSLYNANPAISSQEMFDGLQGFVAGDNWVRNTISYINMYLPVMIAATTGVELSAIKVDLLDKDTLEKAAEGSLFGDVNGGTSEDSIPEDALPED